MRKFRRGKKFQEAYFDIGNTNCMIQNLIIEAESFERHENFEEAESRRSMANRLKLELKEKYEADDFDLDYYIPQSSGLYNTNSKKDTLK